MMKTPDQLNRYIFDDVNVRGELVQLEHSYQSMLENHNYPDHIAQVIGELFAATSLLTATLKFEGDIAVQIQGDGPVSYISINGSHDQKLRGVARWQQEPESTRLSDLVGTKGFMVITITPAQGERYQGVVALERDNLAACLEDYFRQSEQLETQIWLFADTKKQQAAGILLQAMPAPAGKSNDDNQDDLAHLTQLTATISAEELFSLAAQDVLYRLYHQEKVRVFEPTPVSFKCGCSREKSLNALTSIQPVELQEILNDEGLIKVKCEYCLTESCFNQADIQHLLTASQTKQ